VANDGETPDCLGMRTANNRLPVSPGSQIEQKQGVHWQLKRPRESLIWGTLKIRYKKRGPKKTCSAVRPEISAKEYIREAKYALTGTKPKTNRMKLVILSAVLSSIATAAATVVEQRGTGGYIQRPSGSASFTQYSGCSTPGTFSLCYKASYADFV
jgi:hypothetical protein